MARTKIDYGIDLGTTNSAIAVMNQGQTTIIKNEVQMDTTRSCVYFNKKKSIFVGEKAYNNASREAVKVFGARDRAPDAHTNSFLEFKRTMGTDQAYESSFMDRSFSSEELSAEVLKKLKNLITTEEISAAVITVPAKFEQHQVDATQRAAELAGFRYVELLQEPTAASMAYGIDGSKTDGYWLVFDFGGGTFDAALMRVEEGIIRVVDTEGDNHLGGKNLDYAIVDHILVPKLREQCALDRTLSDERKKKKLRDALKFPAEEIKIALSVHDQYDWCPEEPFEEDDDGEEIDVDIHIQDHDFLGAAGPIFQRAIDISLKLLRKNHLNGSDLETVILAGGPTLSKLFRAMIREQISEKIDTRIDPMTAVARGAALFASTKDIPLALQNRNRTKVQLSLKYPETTVEPVENLGVRVDREQTDGDFPAPLFIDIERSDKGWSSGKIAIEEDAEIIEINLEEGKPNGFRISLYDDKGTPYPCEPEQFTIINGFIPPKATLAFDRCINIFNTQNGREVLDTFQGLEKNQSLPAKGKGTYKTQRDIRPGMTEDVILLPIYDGDKGTRAIHNRPGGLIKITGDDIGEFLPKDSDVEITLEMDSSRRMTVSAYFPYIDETVEKGEGETEEYTATSFSDEDIDTEIKKAQQTLNMLQNELSSDSSERGRLDKLSTDLNEISELFDNGQGDRDTEDQVFRRLKELLRDMDEIQDGNQWPVALEELNVALETVSTTNKRYGNEDSAKIIKKMKENAKIAIADQNIELARELIEEIRTLDFAMIREQTGLWISIVKGYHEDFDMQPWKDRKKARLLIDEAINHINSGNPSKQLLEETVVKLFKLLPDAQEGFPEMNDSLLKK
jgi:molecular chaperone DnaK